jgi:hypothetical protein
MAAAEVSDLPSLQRLEELRAKVLPWEVAPTQAELLALLDCALAVRRLGIADPNKGIAVAREALRRIAGARPDGLDHDRDCAIIERATLIAANALALLEPKA